MRAVFVINYLFDNSVFNRNVSCVYVEEIKPPASFYIFNAVESKANNKE